jgi:hypothetical protein
MRKTVTALLGAFALAGLAGCATGPEPALFAGTRTMVDAPSSVENTAAANCAHNGGWYDQAAEACSTPGQ